MSARRFHAPRQSASGRRRDAIRRRRVSSAWAPVGLRRRQRSMRAEGPGVEQCAPSAPRGRPADRRASAAGAASASVRPAAQASRNAQPRLLQRRPFDGAARARDQHALGAPVEIRRDARIVPGLAGRAIALPDRDDGRVVEPRPARGRMRAQHRPERAPRRRIRPPWRRRRESRRARRGLRSRSDRAARRRRDTAAPRPARKPRETRRNRSRSRAATAAGEDSPARRSRRRRGTTRRRRDATPPGSWPAARRCSPSARCCDRRRTPGCATRRAISGGTSDAPSAGPAGAISAAAKPS